MSEETGFSPWVQGMRHRYHERHIELAARVLTVRAKPKSEPPIVRTSDGRHDRRVLEPEQVDRLMVLLAAGVSRSAASREVGCHRTTAIRYAKAMCEVAEARAREVACA